MLCSKKGFSTIILAAGKGIRMCSNIPKILHSVGGKFILQYVIDVAIEIGSKDIYIVYGDDCDKDSLINIFGVQNNIINWVLQSPSFGTGHAVKQVLPFLSDNMDILILYADVPLISSLTLLKLIGAKPVDGISLLTAFFKKTDGYGRIVRQEDGKVVSIVEDDSTLDEKYKMINEINTGIMIATSQDLKRWVSCIKNSNNINGEFYLTDIINMAWNEGCLISTVLPNEDYEVMGINTKLQLSELERIYQRKQAEYLLNSGVIVSDVNRFDLRGELHHGRDIFIDVNVIIEGEVFLGDRVNIGMGCVLRNSIIDDDVIVYPYTLIDGAKINSHSVIGPFAHLRFGSELKEGSVIGNFVELKNTRLGKRSKINHISYIGDTEVGREVNIGAGVIVCNYDGISKHKTIIGDNVFVGADSQLIAPVTIGSGAKIGAGTTITRNVEPGGIVISRIRQFSITCWKRSLKEKSNNED